MDSEVAPAQILEFWFSEPANRQWFRATPELDRRIRQDYESLWRSAAGGTLDHWEAGPEGALALVILLDQFPLNMFRGRPEAFATEARSREVARRAIERGFDRRLSPDQQRFLYMPFMHSESPADQDLAVELFEAAGLSDNAEWARHHRDIVRRFGRFPHRNAILGRANSAAEQAYLESEEGFRG